MDRWRYAIINMHFTNNVSDATERLKCIMKNWNGQEKGLVNHCSGLDPPDVWAVTRESKNYAFRSEFSKAYKC